MDSTQAPALRREIESLERQLRDKKSQLQDAVRNCRHQWSAVVYDPIITPSYSRPQFAENIGFQRYLQEKHGNMHVPEKQQSRWSKTCSVCGTVEYTTKTQDKVEQVPVF